MALFLYLMLRGPHHATNTHQTQIIMRVVEIKHTISRFKSIGIITIHNPNENQNNSQHGAVVANVENKQDMKMWIEWH